MSATSSASGWAEDALPPSERFDADLIGLDPNDPEARALAAHLDRMEQSRPGFTVEGYLADVGDFASSANRAAGLRRIAAVAVVGLLLLVVAYTVWNALVVAVSLF